MGRRGPNAGEPRFDSRVPVPCYRAQRARWQEAAQRAGLTFAAWARKVMDRAAAKPRRK